MLKISLPLNTVAKHNMLDHKISQNCRDSFLIVLFIFLYFYFFALIVHLKCFVFVSFIPSNLVTRPMYSWLVNGGGVEKLFMNYKFFCGSIHTYRNNRTLYRTHSHQLSTFSSTTLREKQEMHFGPQVIIRKCLQGRLSDYFLKLQLNLFLL